MFGDHHLHAHLSFVTLLRTGKIINKYNELVTSKKTRKFSWQLLTNDTILLERSSMVCYLQLENMCWWHLSSIMNSVANYNLSTYSTHVFFDIFMRYWNEWQNACHTQVQRVCRNTFFPNSELSCEIHVTNSSNNCNFGYFYLMMKWVIKYRYSSTAAYVCRMFSIQLWHCRKKTCFAHRQHMCFGTFCL